MYIYLHKGRTLTGWSKSHFNDLHFIISLEATHIITRAAE